MKREYGGGGNADYGGMVQPSQQHVAPCVKVVEWGLGTRAPSVRQYSPCPDCKTYLFLVVKFYQ